MGVDGGLPAGEMLPIAKVRLKVGDLLDETRPVAPGDGAVSSRVTLKAGTRTMIQSWCRGAEGENLCGAYYAYVTPK